MKKLLVAGAVLCIMVGTAKADQSIGFGGGQSDGHSYSGVYAVKPGMSGVMRYEKYKAFDNIKLSYGASVRGFTWTQRHNGEDKETVEYGVMPAVETTVYVKFCESLQPYVRGGVGAEIGGGDHRGALQVGYGLAGTISENWSVELGQTHSWSSEKRLDFIEMVFKYHF